jgi:hypothetical protein
MLAISDESTITLSHMRPSLPEEHRTGKPP